MSGDIVCADNNKKGVITYGEETAMFFIAFKKWNANFNEHYNGNELEIIGNIYDNPNLLGE